MTPERAQEIIEHGRQWSNYSKHCTADEDKEVRDLWQTMPGHTCWYDALRRIAYPVLTYKKIPFTPRDYDTTNIVACQASMNPDPSRWRLTDDSAVKDLTQIDISWVPHPSQKGESLQIRRFGYL